MNVQIYFRSKCFDSKKAERWFKERGIRVQLIDLDDKGMSPRELDSVIAAVGLEQLIDPKSKSKDAALMRYLGNADQKRAKLLEDPKLIKSPVVRNGRQATVGYAPDIWESWRESEK